jgi:hypothetical protein
MEVRHSEGGGLLHQPARRATATEEDAATKAAERHQQQPQQQLAKLENAEVLREFESPLSFSSPSPSPFPCQADSTQPSRTGEESPSPNLDPPGEHLRASGEGQHNGTT